MIFKIEKNGTINNSKSLYFNWCIIKRQIGLAETHIPTKLNFHIK